MARPTIRIHNTETNEIIDRDMTDEELTDYNANMAAHAAAQAEAEAKAAAREALLDRLGITADEAALLLG
jgi:hypothetical protein